MRTKIVSFVLGKSSRVNSLLVQWPSCQEDIFIDQKANKEFKVIEGSCCYEVITAAVTQHSKADIQNN